MKEYTDLFPEEISNCLFPEGPKALKEIKVEIPEGNKKYIPEQKS